MTGSVIVQAEVHLLELRELPQHLQHGDGGCPAAGHIVMLLPPLREKGDVGEQVDRGLEDIERVIAAEIVKAVPRVAALNVAAIALPYGVQPALMPMTGNAVFIESDEHGVVIFLCPVPGSFMDSLCGGSTKGFAGSGTFSFAVG